MTRASCSGNKSLSPVALPLLLQYISCRLLGQKALHNSACPRHRTSVDLRNKTQYSFFLVQTMPVALQTILLLLGSNIFMTFAWYSHLKNLSQKPWYVAVLVSWGIALFEYTLMVPANRIGYTQLSLPQLKIMQEVITLLVFVPFTVFYMQQPLKLDYLWAGFCLLGAVYFVFRS